MYTKYSMIGCDCVSRFVLLLWSPAINYLLIDFLFSTLANIFRFNKYLICSTFMLHLFVKKTTFNMLVTPKLRLLSHFQKKREVDIPVCYFKIMRQKWDILRIYVSLEDVKYSTQIRTRTRKLFDTTKIERRETFSKSDSHYSTGFATLSLLVALFENRRDRLLSRAFDRKATLGAEGRVCRKIHELVAFYFLIRTQWRNFTFFR